jgi:peptidoglycan/LPS O-acetylase OafA/YrhL
MVPPIAVLLLSCFMLLSLALLLSDESTRFALFGFPNDQRTTCSIKRPLPEFGPNAAACVEEEFEAKTYPDRSMPVEVPTMRYHATIQPWLNVGLYSTDFVTKHNIGGSLEILNLSSMLRNLIISNNLTSPWWCQMVPWPDSKVYSEGRPLFTTVRRTESAPAEGSSYLPRGTSLILNYGRDAEGLPTPSPAGQLSWLHQSVENAVRDSGMECTVQSVAYAWRMRELVLMTSIEGLPKVRAGSHLALTWSCGGLLVLTVVLAWWLVRQRDKGLKLELKTTGEKETKSKQTKPRVLGLDIFKGLAMLGVCASHFLYIFCRPGVGASLLFEDSSYPVLILPLTILSQSYSSVALLFVATGYLSQASLASATKKNPTNSKLSSWYHFVSSRFARVYLMCVFVQLLVIFGETRIYDLQGSSLHADGIETSRSRSNTWINVLENISFSFIWNRKKISPHPIGSLWSIGTSVQFWVIFPALFFLLLSPPRKGGKLPTSLKRGLQAAGLLAIYVVSFIIRNWTITTAETMIKFPRDSIFGRLDDFTTGVLLSLFMTSGGGSKINLSRRMSVAILLLGFSYLTIACYAADAVSLGAVPFWWIYWTATLWQLGGCCILLVLLRIESSFVSPFVWLGSVGKASFSLMLWHSVLHATLNRKMLNKLTALRGGAAHLLMIICLTVYMTWLSYTYFELPGALVGENAELKRNLEALKKAADRRNNQKIESGKGKKQL